MAFFDQLAAGWNPAAMPAGFPNPNNFIGPPKPPPQQNQWTAGALASGYGGMGYTPPLARPGSTALPFAKFNSPPPAPIMFPYVSFGGTEVSLDRLLQDQRTAANVYGGGGSRGGYQGGYGGGGYGGNFGTLPGGAQANWNWQSAAGPGGGADYFAQARDAQNAAKKANEQRYNDILAMRKGHSDQLVKDVNQRFDQRQAQGTQDLINRGLGNTTVTSAVSRGINQDRDAELRRVGDQQMEQQAQFMERRTDSYPDQQLLANLAIKSGQGGMTGSGSYSSGGGGGGVGGGAGGFAGMAGGGYSGGGGYGGYKPQTWGATNPGQTAFQSAVSNTNRNQALMRQYGGQWWKYA